MRPLHLLYLNAGVFSPKDRVTADGFETTFHVNHLTQYYLIQLLQKKMLDSAPGRIVFISSESHRGYGNEKINWAPTDITEEVLSPPAAAMSTPIVAYAVSKLCNILAARYINKELSAQGVTAYAVSPGVVVTDLVRSTTFPMSWYFKIVHMFSKNAEQGASTAMWCGVSEAAAQNAGGYFADSKPKVPSDAGARDDNAAKLHEISLEMIRQHFHI